MPYLNNRGSAAHTLTLKVNALYQESTLPKGERYPSLRLQLMEREVKETEVNT